ncbi:MAG: hypothetical protein JWM34_475 [Ilumatobacteraceae bacterium]|nr:hypothetical protein [Ilumatobacteraceae bacterium]
MHRRSSVKVKPWHSMASDCPHWEGVAFADLDCRHWLAAIPTNNTKEQ